MNTPARPFRRGFLILLRRNRGNRHIDHIDFDADNIDKTFAEIKEAAFNILEEQPVFLSFGKKGCKYLNKTGPDGERLEYNQI
ncbi:MAG: hypothetical protein ACXWWC_07125 [Chitinophagaceae bacterium]